MLHHTGDSKYIVTALGVVVFVSVYVTIPTMVASQAMYLVNQAYTQSSPGCFGSATYATIYKVDTCQSKTKFSCLNSTHYSVTNYKSDLDCGSIASSNMALIGCQRYEGEINIHTTCMEDSLPQPPSNSYISTQFSTNDCLPDTEIHMEHYPLNSCFRKSANSWAKYTCINGAVHIRSNCDSQCEVCDNVAIENLGQCTDGTKHICIKGCDLEARHHCESQFARCDLQSSACDCYQSWGQCVYDSGCDQDATAEKYCRQFCDSNEPCQCNFAQPCENDSLSNSLLANLVLMGGSILIYFFLSL